MSKRVHKNVLIAGLAGAMLLSPVTVFAATDAQPTLKTQVVLNGRTLSTPFAFVYQNTTYMPLFYVQQLLNQLNIKNHWNGQTWTIDTSFASQPAFQLKTTSGSMAIDVNSKSFANHINKTVATDPTSKEDTTFIPIWYMMQALKSIGLESTWSNHTWSVNAGYQDVSKSGTQLGTFSTLADAKAALADYPGGTVRNEAGQNVFTEASFTQVDLRYSAPSNVNATSLNTYLSNHNSIMAGLGEDFMEAQSDYGVNANYLVSHAMEETGSNGNASAIAINKNNLYGYGAFDSNAAAAAGTFPSEGYAILYQAWEVRNNYLNPSSSNYVTPTLDGMSKNYASDPEWATKINNLMDQLAIDMHDSVTSYQQYTPNNQPSTPSNSGVVPDYKMFGANGLVTTDLNYQTKIPVYANGGDGHQHMFVRPLSLGDVGDDVQTLQRALNQQDGANLQTDGRFGPATQVALKDYQSAHGLSPTGTCDFHLWNDVLQLSTPASTVQAGQSITIDAIEEGMAGGNVTAWYHISNIGWINASDVRLQNVYRIIVPNPASASDVSVPVQNSAGQVIATLHAGDFVVNSGVLSSGASNQHAIQFVDQISGTSITGLISSDKASLTKVDA